MLWSIGCDDSAGCLGFWCFHQRSFGNSLGLVVCLNDLELEIVPQLSWSWLNNFENIFVYFCPLVNVFVVFLLLPLHVYLKNTRASKCLIRTLPGLITLLESFSCWIFWVFLPGGLLYFLFPDLGLFFLLPQFFRSMHVIHIICFFPFKNNEISAKVCFDIWN